MAEVVCKLCGKPIEMPRLAWRESIGWVSPDGAKAMTGAKQTGELAHEGCISLLRAGVAFEQESLLE